jgi:hypothetical protein
MQLADFNKVQALLVRRSFIYDLIREASNPSWQKLSKTSHAAFAQEGVADAARKAIVDRLNDHLDSVEASIAELGIEISGRMDLEIERQAHLKALGQN